MVIEVKKDPMSRLPPHITLAQAKKFSSTLLQGDPDQAGILKQTAKQLLAAILPGRDKDE